jgi:Domain of unknown function (DUF3459)
MRVNPPNPDWRPGGWTWEKHLRVYSEDRHEIVRERRAVADEYEDRVLIGEIYLPLERLLVYYGEDLSPNAGFCRKGVAPWLPVGGDVERDNVEAQRDDPGAMLSLTRRLISLRRTTPALRSGSYEPAAGAPEGCFAFSRRLDEQEAFVALNLGAGEAEEPLPRTANDRPWRVLLSTHGESQEGRELRRAVRLGGYEGLLLTLDHS